MSTTSSAPSFAQFAKGAENDETPVPVPIKDRDGDPYLGKSGQPITFQVIGEYSKPYRAAEKRLVDKAIKRARRGDDRYSADDAELNAWEKTAAGIVGWNVEDEEGTPVPFSSANVVAFFRVAPWVATDIDRAIRGHATFFTRASET